MRKGMRIGRRILSVFLTLILVLGLIPEMSITVKAEEAINWDDATVLSADTGYLETGKSYKVTSSMDIASLETTPDDNGENPINIKLEEGVVLRVSYFDLHENHINFYGSGTIHISGWTRLGTLTINDGATLELYDVVEGSDGSNYYGGKVIINDGYLIGYNSNTEAENPMMSFGLPMGLVSMNIFPEDVTLEVGGSEDTLETVRKEEVFDGVYMWPFIMDPEWSTPLNYMKVSNSGGSSGGSSLVLLEGIIDVESGLANSDRDISLNIGKEIPVSVKTKPIDASDVTISSSSDDEVSVTKGSTENGITSLTIKGNKLTNGRSTRVRVTATQGNRSEFFDYYVWVNPFEMTYNSPAPTIEGKPANVDIINEKNKDDVSGVVKVDFDSSSDIVNANTITWSSSDPSVATAATSGIDYDNGFFTGKITAKKVGNTTITVSVPNADKSLTYDVTVNADISVGIDGITEHKDDMGKGDSKELNAIVHPMGIVSGDVTWTSSNEEVASITEEDGTYTLTANKQGTAKITATSVADNTKSDYFDLTVGNPTVSSVTIDRDTLGLTKGGKGKLAATVLPEDLEGEDKVVTWSSDNDAVATVDESGTVSAIDYGQAIITATSHDGKKSDTCTVKVIPPVESIQLDKSMTIVTGGTQTLKPVIAPDSAADMTLEWTSSANSVATVDKDGKVTSVAKGKTTVTCTATNGTTDTSDDVSASCVVTVADQATGISFNPSSLTLNRGETYKLQPVFTPEGSYSELVWTSSDNGDATVDENGVVTAKGSGDAKVKIKAEFKNDSNTYAECTITLKTAFVVQFVTEDHNGVETELSRQIVEVKGRARKPADPVQGDDKFQYWTMTKNGETEFDFDNYSIQKDITLYAKWIPVYTVSFDVGEGASTAAPQTQKIEGQVKATKPDDPKKEGYAFKYWYYIDKDGKEQTWDFENNVTNDLELHAKWSEGYQVSFVTNGGTEIPPIMVGAGGLIEVEAPEKENYAFAGWYKDEALKNKWDLEKDTVTQATILYAKWAPTYKVSFVTNCSIELPGITVPEGDKIQEPAELTNKDYFEFKGWYSDEGLTQKWNFDTDTVTQDLTLYASWNDKRPTITYVDENGESREVHYFVLDRDLNSLSLEDGEFYAPESGCAYEIEISERVTANGTANLILTDNSKVIAPKGITVKDTLNIYGQESGSGKLYAGTSDGETVTCDSGRSGIGSDVYENNVNINFYGGSTYAKGNGTGAGVGGDYLCNGCNVKVINASVEASGNQAFGRGQIGKADGTLYLGEGLSLENNMGGSLMIHIQKTESAGYQNDYLHGTFMRIGPERKTVTFDSRGGTDVKPQTPTVGTKITKPEDPIMSPTMIFDKWTTDLEGKNEWNFTSDVVDEDITLYAQWTDERETLSYIDKDGNVQTAKVNVIDPDYPATFNWKDGEFYAAYNNGPLELTIDKTIYTSGTVNLILADGSYLNCAAGLYVPATAGNDINIFCQAGCSGGFRNDRSQLASSSNPKLGKGVIETRIGKCAYYGNDDFIFKAWGAGETLELRSDITLKTAKKITSGTYTIDLKGHNVYLDSEEPDSIFVVDGGNLIIKDTVGRATISGATDSAIKVLSGSVVQEGGTIRDNTGVKGGGVYVEGGTYTITGSVDDNDGTPIYMEAEVIYNTCTECGGGVYVGPNGTMNVSNKPIIQFNKLASDNSIFDNVCVENYVTVTGSMVKGAVIYINKHDSDGNVGFGTFAKAAPDYNGGVLPGNDSGKFVSDDDQYIVNSDTGAYLKGSVKVKLDLNGGQSDSEKEKDGMVELTFDSGSVPEAIDGITVTKYGREFVKWVVYSSKDETELKDRPAFDTKSPIYRSGTLIAVWSDDSQNTPDNPGITVDGVHYNYIADGARIIAYRDGSTVIEDGNVIELSAPEDPVYDGEPKEATLTDNDKIFKAVFPGNYTIEYWRGDTKLSGAPTDVGTYMVTAEIEGLTIGLGFKIEGQTPAIIYTKKIKQEDGSYKETEVTTNQYVNISGDHDEPYHLKDGHVYVVNGEVTLNAGLIYEGDVAILFRKEAKLTVKGGVTHIGSTLSIYAEKGADDPVFIVIGNSSVPALSGNIEIFGGSFVVSVPDGGKLFADDISLTLGTTQLIEGLSGGVIHEDGSVTYQVNELAGVDGSFAVVTQPDTAIIRTAPADAGRIYSGQAQELVTAGVAVGGTMQYALGTATGATEAYTTSIPAKTNAGTYYVWYKAVGDSEHSDSAAACVTAKIGSMSIEGAAITLSDISLPYNETEQSVTVIGVKLGDSMLVADKDYEVTSGAQGTAINTYTLTITGKGNYQGSAETQWSIVPRLMSVAAENVSCVYDGNAHGITVEVKTPATGATVKYGLEEGKYELTQNPTISNAGGIPLTVYYKVTADTSADYTGSATITVSPKPVKVSGLTAENKVYDGTVSANIISTGAAFDGKLNKDDLTVSAEGVFDNEKAGTGKKVTISGLELGGTGAGNYMLASEGQQAEASAEISQRPVTVTANDQTIDLGGSIQGSDVALATLKDALTGHTLSAITLTTSYDTSHAGSGKITPSGATISDGNNDVTSNYKITYADGTLKVSTGASAITKAPQAKEGLVYDGSDKVLIDRGTAEGGTMYYALSSDGTTEPASTAYGTAEPTALHAGQYTVYYKVKGDSDHDDCLPASITVNIAPKEIGLEWGNTTLVYSGAPLAPTVTATGLAGKDTCKVTVTGAQTYTGTYEAKAISVDNKDYRLPEAALCTKEFKIVNAEMAVTAKGYDGAYDGAAHSIKVTVTSPADAEVKYSTTEDGNYSAVNPSFTDPGSYKVYYKAEKDNYNSATGYATVVIRPKKPDSGEGYSIDYKKEKISWTVGYELRKSDGGDWMDSTHSPISLTPGAGYEIRKTIISGADPIPSEALLFYAASRPNTPDKASITVNDETVKGQNDGSISGLGNGMEYRYNPSPDASPEAEGWTAWTAVIGDALTGLAPGTYEVRIQATDTAPSSESLRIPIKTSVDYGDVLSDDIPADGKIPEGIWIAGIKKELKYTGEALVQDFRLYDGKKLLSDVDDYSYSYRNNKKAYTLENADNPTKNDEKKAPKLILSMKGNYSEKKTVYFNIARADISGEDFSVSDMTSTFSGKKQTPAPTLTWNGNKLAAGTDFTVKEFVEKKNDKEAFKGAADRETVYDLTVAGKGNFTGERKIRFTIAGNTTGDKAVPVVLMSDVRTKSIPDQNYTGKEFDADTLLDKKGNKFILTATYKQKDLIPGKDYEIEFVDATDAGRATVILRGLNCSDSETGICFVGEKRLAFKIIGTSITKAIVKGLENSYVYTGEPIEPAVTLEGVPVGAYSVDYENNVNVGSATVIITGKNGFSGTKKVKFKISKYDLNNADVLINGAAAPEISAAYIKDGPKPDIVVTFRGRKLKEGRDYTLKYENNNKVAGAKDIKPPTVTVKGRGMFNGKRAVPFTVTQREFNDESGFIILCADIVENSKPGKFITSVNILDSNGKMLKAGKDYDIDHMKYFDAEKGTELTMADRPTAGTRIKVLVAGIGFYTGEASGEYRILPKNKDISKAVIKIADQKYTGEEVKITSQEQFAKDKQGAYCAFHVSGKQRTPLVLGRDFEIVEGTYSDNIKKGNAKVTLHGIGEYGGYKTVSFKIGTRSIKDVWSGIISGLFGI